MERVQHMTKSAIRRASQIEVNPQAKRNLQELFVNFTLILICLLLIYIIVLLSSWEQAELERVWGGCAAKGLADIWLLLIHTDQISKEAIISPYISLTLFDNSHGGGSLPNSLSSWLWLSSRMMFLLELIRDQLPCLSFSREWSKVTRLLQFELHWYTVCMSICLLLLHINTMLTSQCSQDILCEI